MRRIEAVLFDLDGTLLDTAPDLIAALNFVRGCEGLEAVAVETMSRYVSQGVAGLLQAGLPGVGESNFHSRKHLFLQRYAENSFVNSRLYDGIPEVLDFLENSGIPWGVVTNKVEAFALPIMKESGLSDRCSCVVCGDTLERNKPDPAPVVLACAILEVPVENTLFVGDDVRDLQAGRAAGTWTAAVHYGYGSAEFDQNLLEGSAQIAHPLDIIAVVTGSHASENMSRAN